MNGEAEHWRAMIAGLAGGVFFALIHLGATVLNGQTPSRQDIWRAAFNVGLAVVAGGLAAYFLTDVLVKAVPLASLRDPRAVAFVIGALAWVTSPMILEAARKFAAKKAEGVGQ
ncbi:hypothetical protein BH11PSE1_BH11PSE1_16380 [soil metagenome]